MLRRLSRFCAATSLIIGTTVACAPPAHQPASSPSTTSENANLANHDSTPESPPSETPARPEFTPCSEDSPSGCKAAAPRRVKLDPGLRYTVEVHSDDPSLGPASAPVTLVVFSDYQCPFCARLEPVLTELRARFPEHLRIVWKDLPLVFHEYALPAAVLGREAFTKYGNDGFWRVHAELFIHQRSFTDEWFSDFARSEKLTWPPVASHQARINTSLEQAESLGVAATPTVFVNGRPVEGAQHISVYTDLINEELEQ